MAPSEDINIVVWAEDPEEKRGNGIGGRGD